MARFWLFSLLGGILGVILTSVSGVIPVLNWLNICCLLNIVGAMAALALYFEFNSDAEPITDGQSLMFGALSGAISGTLSMAVLALVVFVVVGLAGSMAALEGNLPPELAAGGTMFIVAAVAFVVIGILVNTVGCALGCWGVLNVLLTDNKVK